MKLNVYVIYDSAAKTYSRPMVLQNDGIALRAFMNMVNKDDGTDIYHHPDQFTMFRIGEYNDQTALISAESPKSLGNGIEYQEKIEVDVGEKKFTEEMRKLLDEYFRD